MRKKLKIFGIAILIIFIAVWGRIVNTYLSDNHLLIYATGTKDKAFLNATWKMSPQEIERANRISPLSGPEVLDLFDLQFVPALMNNRFKEFNQKDVYLWGHRATVEYSFFDDMLYEYHISFDVYDPEELHKEILETLRGRFGTGKENESKSDNLIYSCDWDTEKQTVSYWMGKSEDKTYYVGIKARYKPFYKQIEEIAKNEKKAYF